MDAREWLQWMGEDGRPVADAPIKREPIYTGRNGKKVERWTLEGEGGAVRTVIFKPLTNPDTKGREAWLDEHLLPRLSVAYENVIAHSDSTDPDRYWILKEDLGELDHTLTPEMVWSAAKAAAKWHSLPCGVLPSGSASVGHTPGVGEVVAQIRQRQPVWTRIASETGFTPRQVERMAGLCAEAPHLYFDRTVVSHGDYYPLNIAFVDGRLAVIDWEFAQLNCVYWDLYNLLDVTSPSYRRPALAQTDRMGALLAYAEAREEEEGRTLFDRELFVEGYMRYALYHSLWVLTLIEGDLAEDRHDRSRLLEQKEETVHVVRCCLRHFMEPLVSVLTPTYNRPLALCEMLEGLRRQTVQDFEAIVVNDAGDSVEDVCRLYPELDIRVVNLSENVKHCRARNEGLRAARGNYVMFCDDDDLLLPRHLERMLEEIAGCDLVYSDAEIVGYRVEDGMRVPQSRLVFAYRYDPQGMREFSTFIPSGCLYRKEIHDAIGPFDEEMYHYWDWDFILRVAERWRVKRVPAASVLYSFSQEGGNASSDTEPMRPYLDKLSAKHGLGHLPTKNFFLLLEEEGVRGRKADTEIQWDGMPLASRCRAAGLKA